MTEDCDDEADGPADDRGKKLLVDIHWLSVPRVKCDRQGEIVDAGHSAIHPANQPNANARRPRRGGPGSRAGLQGLDWQSIDAQDWKAAFVKEAKQAEFLVFESFPWTLVERIGVIDATRQAAVAAIVSGAAHAPPIQLRRDWYY